jgi:hypothetical protein
LAQMKQVVKLIAVVELVAPFVVSYCYTPYRKSNSGFRASFCKLLNVDSKVTRIGAVRYSKLK